MLIKARKLTASSFTSFQNLSIELHFNISLITIFTNQSMNTKRNVLRNVHERNKCYIYFARRYIVKKSLIVSWKKFLYFLNWLHWKGFKWYWDTERSGRSLSGIDLHRNPKRFYLLQFSMNPTDILEKDRGKDSS